FLQAEDGIRAPLVTGVQTCALPIWLGARVLPAGVSLVDDPSARDFRGTPLIGSYAVDNEGVRAQKVTLVDSGNLKNELMSRRPGPDFNESNGHGRAAFLNDAKPTMS